MTRRIDPTRRVMVKRPRASRGQVGASASAGARHRRRPLVEPLEDRTLLASPSILGAAPTAMSPGPSWLATPLGGGTASPVGLRPAQVAQAYGFNTIAFQGGIQGDGTGQTIAIVDPFSDSAFVPSGSPGFNASDLAQFDKQFDLPDPTFTIAMPDGTPQQAPAPNLQGSSWGEETALDVEWAHAPAPGAAILLVETPGGTTSQIDQGLIDGVNYVRNQPGVSVISMSWTEGTIVSDATFTTPAGHEGITFVAGSGDYGSPASYPATSPNVLAVGGTYFPTALDQEGDYTTEAAWSASGGGIDTAEPQPAAQAQAIGADGGRAAPDVAFDAGTPLAVIDSYDYGSTPWVALSGTSIGAPAWSALVAIADQGRALAGQGTLDGASQTIPDLYATYQTAGYPAAFNDITSGGNNLDQAGTGYDLVTGLGTPKAAAIAATLSGNVDAPSLIAPAQGAIVTTTTPTFQWSPVVGGSGYTLTVTDTTTGEQVISYSPPASASGGSVTSYTPTTPLAAGDAYSWNVGAVTAGGDAAVSPQQSLSFVIIPAPTPTGPSGVVDSTTPTLQWSAVPGSAGYSVTLNDVTTGAIVANEQTVASPSYTPASALNDLDTYAWSVATLSHAEDDGSPYTSPPSGWVYFTVNIDVPPVTIAPANEASVTTTTPTFQWSAVAEAVSYNLILADEFESTGSSSVFSVPGTSYTPTTPLTGSYYSWYVQAFVNVLGTTVASTTSEPSWFSISASGQPVTLISPPASATVTTATPTLEWSFGGTVDEGGWFLDLLDVTTSTSVILGLSIDSQGDSFPVPVPLENGHTYRWSVWSDTSQTAEFTVSLPGGGAQTLAAPTPIAPSGVIDTDSPTFEWTAVPGAVDYGFFIDFDDGSTYSSPMLVPGTSISLPSPLFTATVFTWNVVAYDNSGDFSPPSIASDLFCNPPAVGSLPAPTDLAPSGTVASYTPTLSWSAVPGAVEYDVWGFDETVGGEAFGFGSPTPLTSEPENGEDFPPLANGHTYRWYVEAFNYSGTSLAVSQTFTVSGPPIGVPTQVSPAAGSVVNTETPTLQWSPVANATSYVVYLYGGDSSGTPVTGISYTQPASLLNDVTYQWQVSAVVDIGGVDVTGPASPVATYTISVPGTTTLDPQGDSGTLTTATPTFQWSPVAGAAGYDLYLEDTTAGTQVFGGLPVISTSYVVAAPLNNGDHYQWYVSAYDNYGDIGLAPTPLAFTVSVPQVSVPAPQPTGPIGQVKGATPTLQWSPVANAAGYNVYINDTTTGKPIPGSPFSVPAGSGGGDLSYPLATPLPVADSYSFYVRAVFANGSLGAPGRTDDFTVSTASDLAGPPTPQGPAGAISATQPTFRWSSVSNAAGYEIAIDDTTDNTIGYVLDPTSVAGASYSLGQTLTPGHTYQWQVAAYDASGQETAWSSPTLFSISSSQPALAAPGGTITTAGPTFAWSAVPGAAGYRVEIADVTGGASILVVGPTNVAGTSYSPAAVLTPGHTYQWQVAAFDSAGVMGPWSSPTTFLISSPSQPPVTPPLTPAPPVVSGLVGVTHAKKKLVAITIAFDEALAAGSASSASFYQVTPVMKKRKKVVFGAPLTIASVSYDGSRDVMVRLARPAKGPLRLVVLPGIAAADGAASEQTYTVTVD